MRIPHTVPNNTLQAYEPSPHVLTLIGEQTRLLRAEDFTWDDVLPPSLVDECIRVLVSEFDEHKRVLPLLEENNIILLLEILPTDLSLDIVIPLIPDGVYWQRRCKDTWSTMNDVTRYEDSWKRMFTERYIEGIIESEEPGYTDWSEFGNILKLCSPIVKRLEITQLRPPRNMEALPRPPDLCNTEEFIPEHLDLSPVLTILNNLQELSLKFGVKNMGMDFKFQFFRVHVKDVERLGKGLSQSKHLKTLRILCSDIDDGKLNIILKSLEHCEEFKELEISHCKISNVGAKSLGHFITLKHSLEHLKLQNNLITAEGAEGLAYSLAVEGKTKLDTLDLKFNLIGDEGGRSLASALAKSEHPRHLILAGCGLGEDAGLDFVQMIKLNKSLLCLDLTNNSLGTEVGYMLSKGVEQNKVILKLDVRNCGFDEECEDIIYKLTFKNREKLRKKTSSIRSTVMKAIRRGTSFVENGNPFLEL